MSLGERNIEDSKLLTYQGTQLQVPRHQDLELSRL